jgi:hypothetical protein
MSWLNKIFRSNNTFNEKKAFYENAFFDYFYRVWENTPFKDKAYEKAFFHAHTVFLNDNLYTENDRRNLLFNYLLPFMSADSDEDVLKKAISILPTDNLYVKRALRAICSSYDENPTRTFDVGVEQQETVFKLIQEALVTPSMRATHETAKLASKSLNYVYFKDENTPQIEVIQPEYYSYNDNHTELWIHRQITVNGEVKDGFWIWTATSFKAQLVNGRDVTSFVVNTTDSLDSAKNPYGVIPCVELNLNSSFGNTDNTLWELVKAQLDVNRLDFSETNNVLFTAFSMFLAKNIDFGNDIKFGIGKVITLNKLENSMTAAYEAPELDIISPESQFFEINQLKDTNIKNTLRKLDLPSSMIDENINLPSGTALKIERIGLDEYRKRDEVALKIFEKQLIQLILKVYNIDYVNTLDENMDIVIEYNKVTIPTEPTADYELSTQQFNAGLLSLANYVNKNTGADVTTEEDALKFIENNLTILTKIRKMQIKGEFSNV